MRSKQPIVNNKPSDSTAIPAKKYAIPGNAAVEKKELTIMTGPENVIATPDISKEICTTSATINIGRINIKFKSPRPKPAKIALPIFKGVLFSSAALI